MVFAHEHEITLVEINPQLVYLYCGTNVFYIRAQSKVTIIFDFDWSLSILQSAIFLMKASAFKKVAFWVWCDQKNHL